MAAANIHPQSSSIHTASYTGLQPTHHLDLLYIHFGKYKNKHVTEILNIDPIYFLEILNGPFTNPQINTWIKQNRALINSNIKFKSGKYAGRTYSEVAQHDSGYMLFLTDKNTDLKRWYWNNLDICIIAPLNTVMNNVQTVKANQDMIINFGKYDGLSMVDIYDNDPEYIEWLYFNTNRELYKLWIGLHHSFKINQN